MQLQVDLLFCTFRFRLKELSIFEIWNRPLGRFSYRLSYSVGTLYLPARQALVLNLELGTVLHVVL